MERNSRIGKRGIAEDRVRPAPLYNDPALAVSLAAITPAGVLTGHRLIRDGDEDLLFPEERAEFGDSVAEVLRRSGAARSVARELLAMRGMPNVSLPRAATRAPVWPPGIVGSLAHDKKVAIAAIAGSERCKGLGIDVEPAEPLPPDVIPMIATAAERRCYGKAVLQSRLLFAIKEAVYKALNPLDGRFIEFQDVEVELDAGRARVQQGASVTITFSLSPRVVALALVPLFFLGDA